MQAPAFTAPVGHVSIKVLGIIGYSGAGKTTLISALLPQLHARGLRVSVIKHTHHSVEMDVPGKDSWRHRQAGAQQVMLVSAQQMAVFTTLAAPLSLAEQLAQLQAVDLVLLEGQKWQAIPKIEVHRTALAQPLLCTQDAMVVAVASDALLPVAPVLLALNDVTQIAEFIWQWWKGA